jgi:hypothetical protein
VSALLKIAVKGCSMLCTKNKDKLNLTSGQSPSVLNKMLLMPVSDRHGNLINC